MLGPWVMQSLSIPFDRADYNCALWAADAVRHMTGFDPAADLRGQFARWHDWVHLMRAEGGLLGAVGRRMQSPLLQPWVSEAEGVAVAHIGARRLCAVISGGRVLARMDHGLMLAGPETVMRGWTWLPR